ncbi:MAG: YafY family transcriptional regulator [Clostridia bacterium]|nr:YafY family transcriptional regulator [Clostridia bacterium]
MKFEIMTDILFDLLANRNVKASELARKYGVCTRTIFRYLNCLDGAGVPLYTVRGRNGGIRLVDTYRMSSTFMTVKEFEQVINSLTAIVSGVPDKTLASAINKLKATVKPEYGGFDVKSGNLIIDGGPGGDTVGYKAQLPVIEKSLNETIELFIRYHDRNGTVSERTIEPHVIVFKQGIWYIYAYCRLRNEFRFFKTGRIETAVIRDKKFVRRDLSEQDLPLDFWHNSVKAERVVMEIDKSVLSDVEEWLGIENVKQNGDKFFADVSLPFDDGLVSKIMSYSSGLKVLSPDTLKDKIKATALAVAGKYR